MLNKIIIKGAKFAPLICKRFFNQDSAILGDRYSTNNLIANFGIK
jgi:hypothetical protein